MQAKGPIEMKIGTADSVIIYTIMDDAGYGTSFYAQHGISFLLDITAENKRKRVLFDVGQSAQPILHNMKAMRSTLRLSI